MTASAADRKALASLAKKLAKIALGHGEPAFAPPLAEEAVARLEETIGAPLPEPYRAFVRGVAGGENRIAGALELVLLGPEQALAELDGGRPGAPFPGGEAAQAAAFPLAGPLDGALPIGDRGCGELDCLVLQGPEAGTMWHRSERGWAPCSGGARQGREGRARRLPLVDHAAHRRDPEGRAPSDHARLEGGADRAPPRGDPGRGPRGEGAREARPLSLRAGRAAGRPPRAARAEAPRPHGEPDRAAPGVDRRARGARGPAPVEGRDRGAPRRDRAALASPRAVALGADRGAAGCLPRAAVARAARRPPHADRLAAGGVRRPGRAARARPVGAAARAPAGGARRAAAPEAHARGDARARLRAGAPSDRADRLSRGALALGARRDARAGPAGGARCSGSRGSARRSSTGSGSPRSPRASRRSRSCSG